VTSGASVRARHRVPWPSPPTAEEKRMPRCLAWVTLCLFAVPAMAADVEAGKRTAATVCAACHGADGVSVSERIPHLAGQRAGYLAGQLEAFKSGARKSDIMNAIAPQLSADDIANVAAHFAAQTGATAGARSPLLPNVARTRVTLPADFGTGYRRYLVRNSPETKQVSLYYATDAAMAAAAAGKPLPDGAGIYIEVHAAKLGADGAPLRDADGNFIPGDVQSYTAMARDKDWGNDIPAMLRNDNWNYAVFAADRTLRTTVNQAECLACHKPRERSSFLFLHDELVAAARK
jgi:cytochrome c553